MANLKSISEQAWKQLFPNGDDEAPITKGQMLASAKSEYAYQMWVYAKNEMQLNGYFSIPSHLLTETEVDVVDNKISLKGLNALTSLGDEWLQNVGGLGCSCNYVKSTVNDWQLMCDDDSIGENSKVYIIMKEEVTFPKGAHNKKLKIIYVNNGQSLNEDKIEVDDAMGGIIRRSLIELYGGKIGTEDKTNNSNSQN